MLFCSSAALDGIYYHLNLLRATESNAETIFESLVRHELNLIVLFSHCLLQFILDSSRILDEDEVGTTLIHLETREITELFLKELAVPFHLISHVTIVIVAFEGSKSHSFRETCPAPINPNPTRRPGRP